MSWKLRIFVAIILFILAFITRYASYLDVQEVRGRHEHIFVTVGAGSDPDAQMGCAINFAHSYSNDAVNHYDYFFLCPLMSAVFAHANYVDSVMIIIYGTILIGAITAVTPFLLLSEIHKKAFSLGGLIASLVLVFNPLLIDDTSGRLLIYPLVGLFFTFFYVFYCLAMYKKTLGWLIALGTMAVLSGISKPFSQINDIPVMLLFPFLYLFDGVDFFKQFPFIKVKFKLSFREIIYAFTPLLVFVIGTVGYEVLYYFLTGDRGYLSVVFFPTAEYTIKEAALGNSVYLDIPVWDKARTLFSLMLTSFHITQRLVGVFFWLAGVAIIGLALRSSRRFLALLASVVLFGVVLASLIYATKVILLPNIYAPEPGAWKLIDFIQLSLFITFFTSMIFYSKKFFGLVALQAAYLVALGMTLPSVHQTHLFVTLVIWLVLCIGFCLDEFFSLIFRFYSGRIKLFFLLVTAVLFSFSFISSGKYAIKQYQSFQAEKEYLGWVRTVVAQEDYIVGGINDNLIWLSNYTQKPIVYNGKYNGKLFTPGVEENQYLEFKDLEKFISGSVQNPQLHPQLYFLDSGATQWQTYFTAGGLGHWHKGDYRLEEVASHPITGRKVFHLVAVSK